MRDTRTRQRLIALLRDLSVSVATIERLREVAAFAVLDDDEHLPEYCAQLTGEVEHLLSVCQELETT